MASRIQTPPGATELVTERTSHSKTFAWPDSRRRWVGGVQPVHFKDAADTWQEPNRAFRAVGQRFETILTPYVLSVEPRQRSLTYTLGSGSYTIQLVGVDGALFTDRPTNVALTKAERLWLQFGPDFALEIVARDYEVEIYKHLLGPDAPRALTWRLTTTGDVSGIHATTVETKGLDNADKSAASRQSELTTRNQRRSIELVHASVAVDATTQDITETMTGRTLWIDPVTRIRSWRDNELTLPVMIDTVFGPAGISNNLDDGYAILASGNWYPDYANYATIDETHLFAARWTSVTVAQGVTINSASVALRASANEAGHTGNSTWKGHDVDNAPQWAAASANSPATMAATTASISVGAFTIGTNTLTVTAIVQEIIDRAGWASGNALRIGQTTAHSQTGSPATAQDFRDAGTDDAKLTIDYTAAGGDTLFAQALF